MSERNRNAAIGLGALAALAAVGWLLFLYLGGFFKPGFEVTASFERAGQLLRPGSDVKIRGVLVGEVTTITVDRTGEASVDMRIFPDQEIPQNVTAAIRAKTLFGEKFIELRYPKDPAEDHLTAGDEIPQDRTISPFEVETIIRNAVPLLEAIDPVKFAAALEALAQGVVGQEDELRRATVQGAKALRETEATLPNLENNLVHLRNFASALDRADADLLRALGSLEVAGRTIERKPGELQTVLDSLGRLGRDLGDIFQARHDDLSALASEGRAVLETVAPADLQRIVRLLDSFLGVWIADLSSGPYWRIFVTEAPTFEAAQYRPGEEPSPASGQSLGTREELLGRLLGDAEAATRGLGDVLLAPVPDDTLGRAVDRLTGGLAP